RDRAWRYRPAALGKRVGDVADTDFGTSFAQRWRGRRRLVTRRLKTSGFTICAIPAAGLADAGTDAFTIAVIQGTAQSRCRLAILMLLMRENAVLLRRCRRAKIRSHIDQTLIGGQLAAAYKCVCVIWLLS